VRIADLVNLPADSEADADFEVLDKGRQAGPRQQGVQLRAVAHPAGHHPPGYTIRGSANHPLLCSRTPVAHQRSPGCGWNEIQPGTVVCIARNAWVEVTPTAREYNLGVLLGAWASEGWVSEDRAGSTNTDQHYFDEVLHAYDQVVGGHRYTSPGSPAGRRRRSTNSTFSSTRAVMPRCGEPSR